MKIKLLLIVLGLTLFTSCGEMLSAMSSYNHSNGAKCANWSSKTMVYSDGKYQDGYYPVDETWISNQIKYYAKAYKFDTYYLTSPNDNKYKISIYCSSYYQ